MGRASQLSSDAAVAAAEGDLNGSRSEQEDAGLHCREPRGLQLEVLVCDARRTVDVDERTGTD